MDKSYLEGSISRLTDEAQLLLDYNNEEIQKIMITLYCLGLDVVFLYKKARQNDKENNPNFRYWTYACYVEKGKTAVTVRWRKYRGKGQYSDYIDTSEIKDFRMPAKVFKRCTPTEKQAILEVEKMFEKIRRINFYFAKSLQSMRAIRDISKESLKYCSTNFEVHEELVNDVINDLYGYDKLESRTSIDFLNDHEDEKKDTSFETSKIQRVFTEEDRLAVRRSLGLL